MCIRDSFKYVVEKGMRKARNCRFNFNHFVHLAVQSVVDGVSKVRDVVLARTGKDLVLPRQPGDAVPSLTEVDGATGEPIPLRPTNQLGPMVVMENDRGEGGRVRPIRWNPLEGSKTALAKSPRGAIWISRAC